MTAKFHIGGYAVIHYGGDELSDWAEVARILPTKPDAENYVRQHIGARSLEQAFAQQERFNRTASSFDGQRAHRGNPSRALAGDG
jgi:hypothetical protein